MKFLIMGEFSGRVRDAMIRGGVDAVSCDFRPTERPGPHLQGDVRNYLHMGWDGMIAFPDCTFLCGSGLHWNGRIPGRAEKTEEALKFVQFLLNQPFRFIGLENPIGCISTRISRNFMADGPGDWEILPLGFKARDRIPMQIIQPYEFGEDASKATCIFTKGLPPLVKDPARRFPGRMVEWPRGSGKFVERWGNQTDSGQNRLTPSETRAKDRAETYQGIADAFGDQWGRFLNSA